MIFIFFTLLIVSLVGIFCNRMYAVNPKAISYVINERSLAIIDELRKEKDTIAKFYSKLRSPKNKKNKNYLLKILTSRWRGLTDAGQTKLPNGSTVNSQSVIINISNKDLLIEALQLAKLNAQKIKGLRFNYDLGIRNKIKRIDLLNNQLKTLEFRSRFKG